MNEITDRTEAEVRRIRTRMEDLQRELDVLRDRLDAITAAEDDRPKARQIRARLQLSAGPLPAPEPAATPAPPRTPERPGDPAELLRNATPDTALFALVAGPGSDHDVALLIRTRSDAIAGFGPDPDVEFRAGLFTLGDEQFALVPILTRIGPAEDERIYEAWGNEYAAGPGKLLKRLADQRHVTVWLFGDGGKLERMLHTPNSLRDFAGRALGALAGSRPLAADQFHQARRAVYNQHPSVRSLWAALKGERPLGG